MPAERARAQLPNTATRQFAALVLAPVVPDRVEALRALLAEVAAQTIASMQARGPAQPIVPFEAFASVHYARFVLLESGGATCLAFCTDYDGPEGDARCGAAAAWQHHVADLLEHGRAGLERVFEHCDGFRPGELAAYLARHRRRASTFYVGASGRSLRQIRWEAALRQRVDQVLDTEDLRVRLPEQVRERVLERLRPEHAELPTFPAQPELGARVRWFWLSMALLAAAALSLATAAGAALGASPLAVLGAIAAGLSIAVARFRFLEQTDAQFQLEYSEQNHRHFQAASQQENEFLQNQLTHLVSIKPGPLRWLLIRAVFAVLSVLAANKYNKGRLGDIPSIHFARWVLLPDRQVLFFSNFDSSWQSYLGDFIDRASGGLTAVWSNTVGYPRTRWLLEAGSRDASRFLGWTRHHQLPSQVWYCAYPGLSIVNINDNTEVRRGLADRSAVDAATWLFRLRAVDRVRIDQQYGDEQTRDPALALEDIQGLVLWGYGHMPDARFLLFRLEQPASAELTRWLGELPINSAAVDRLGNHPAEPLLNIAFTERGLLALGVDPALCSRFSTAFHQNSDHPYRVQVNGDVGPSAPEHWRWGSASNPVHVALLVYASTSARASAFAARYAAEASARGLLLVAELEGRTLPDRKEHFGFRDGIAQPTIEGSGRAEVLGNTLAAGEFLLGHRDGYGNVTHSPESDNGFNVGRNGSYLVLRQLEQNVQAFWRYCDAKGNGDAVALASKMVGRWPSGAPLVRHPDRDPKDAAFVDEDDFNYVANDEDNDRYGARCPFGSHVRRANPRDWGLAESRDESLRLANLHRIMRRGRPYGEPLARDMDSASILALATAEPKAESSGPRRVTPGAGFDGSAAGGSTLDSHAASQPGALDAAASGSRGLQFLCLNANIERQFEFIQQQWCNSPKFAGLPGDPDPLLGLQGPAERLGLSGLGFSVQSDVRQGVSSRCNELEPFVTVVGSSYFFMPSLPALRLLGAGLLAGTGVEPLETPLRDEQLYIDRLSEDLGAKLKRDYVEGKTLRDGHPKMHGLVEATFRVESDLPPALRVGLFADPGRSFPAWVRFSNESGRAGPDRRPDVRGAALELMGVPGFKLLEGQEQCTTHDFILTSRETFLARDAAEFSRLIRAMVGGKLALLAFAALHPGVIRRLLASRKRHSDLLALRYFSGVPYLLGEQAVKYSLAPAPRPSKALPTSPSDNFLRERLVADLAEGHASFDFMVQLRARPERMSIEDSTSPWPEAEAPWVKVATLELPRQVFDTPERQELGENLSFNPWRCLPQHRPLGSVNRARRQVYRALSALRHARNAAPSIEPGEAAGAARVAPDNHPPPGDAGAEPPDRRALG